MDATEIDVSVYPEVESRLVGLLDAVTPDLGEIERVIGELEAELGLEVYSALLYLLCHLAFPPEDARSHWQQILEHRRTMANATGSAVDFRVALLDYFISVNQHIKNPKIIEIKIFQKTQSCAIRDELTGLYNYRYLQSELAREITRCRRERSSLSLVLFDVDYFKWYNDRNGHLEGDRALRAVAEAIRGEIRDADLAARYGGEEFAILLPGAGKPVAFKVAERIRERIERLPIRFAARQPGGAFTTSGGVATFRADSDTAEGLIEAADQALYAAKGRGKNQIVSPGNQREFPRIDARIPGRLQRVSAEGESFLTQNVSQQGMRFETSAPFQEGDIFHFTLLLDEVGREVGGLARTVRCRRRSSRYIVQAEIVEISFEEARTLKAYLDRQPR